MRLFELLEVFPLKTGRQSDAEAQEQRSLRAPCFVEREQRGAHLADWPVVAPALFVERGKVGQICGHENPPDLLHPEEVEMRGLLWVQAKHDAEPSWTLFSATAWTWGPVHAQRLY